MTVYVDVNVAFFPWAVQRARGEMAAFEARFPKLSEWRAGTRKPTLKQLQQFAEATHAPVGFFFLPEPPKESLPLQDFRTLGGEALPTPSADLLDVIYACQQRQDWYRDFMRSIGSVPLPFIGSLTTDTAPAVAALQIVTTLGFSVHQRKQCATWEEALRRLVASCEDGGILIMTSGIVGSNTRRVLDPAEFRGFCLADNLAPVVFVNGTDSKSAQMFTLVHEIAHLWLGEAGVSNPTLATTSSARYNEVWCNAVAAEVLVPLDDLRAEHDRAQPLDAEVGRLCKRFKVSSLVMLRRLLDLGTITRATFDAAYRSELTRLSNVKEQASGGGNFYNTEAVRVSKRFATAILASTLEGNTLFRDAARLLGIKKVSTLHEFASRLGVN